MRNLLVLAVSATTVVGALLVASPGDAREVCKRVCDEGYCQQRCWTEDREVYRDRWNRARWYGDRWDRDRRHCLRVGPAAVCD
jgi:hypothetical protein